MEERIIEADWTMYLLLFYMGFLFVVGIILSIKSRNIDKLRDTLFND